MKKIITLAILATITTGVVYLENGKEVKYVEQIKTPSTTRAGVVKDGEIINIVVVPEGWPNVPNAWTPPTGTEVILMEEVSKGDYYDGDRLLTRQDYFEKIKSTTSTPDSKFP